MTLKTFLVILLLGWFVQLQAQDKLVIAGSNENYYVVHLVQEKESLSSIGRIYGYSSKQLAQYNLLNPTANLPIGTKLKVPLTADNFSMQSETATSIPLYHVAEKGDNLFRLSQQYFKVPLASLRTWNDLTTDNVRDGQAIIVGFFTGPKISSVKLSDQDMGSASVVTSLNNNKPLQSEKPPLKNPNIMDAAVDGSRTLQGEMKPLTENELLLLGATQAKIKQSVNNPVSYTEANEYSIEDLGIDYAPKAGDEGFFNVFYEQTTKLGEKVAKTGNAAIFKSTSGFADHKYYVLMNNTLPGTVVKISIANKKNIYARVLGPIPENNHAGNILLYLSNAGAAALGISASSYLVTINYYQ